MKKPEPLALPHPKTANGDARCVGIEIELGGLSEEKVATVVMETLGGQIEQKQDRRIIENSDLGDIEVYLDTRFRDRLEASGKVAKGIASAVVPVEIVTRPILPKDIPRLDALITNLRNAGASGTKDGVLLGFGVHFNPEVRDMSLDCILPVTTAFALLEDYIRDTHPIDFSRAVLPFVDPYPTNLIDALVLTPPETMDNFLDAYVENAPSRDHGLDMTCIFAQHDQDRLAAKMDMVLVGARPTYHYRLPDFRPGEPGWSLTDEWNRWVWLERMSENAGLMSDLRQAWSKHRDQWIDTRKGWARQTADILAKHDEGNAA